MSALPLYFLYPGDLDTPTGGYRYDRRLIGELRDLGREVRTLSLSDRFPFPDGTALDDAARKLASLPDGAVVIIDGLALGAMDSIAADQTRRLRMVALCHHPLALESGLDEARQQMFLATERRALRFVRAVLVTSAATARTLTGPFAVPGEKVVVARPGTDRTPFAPADGQPPRLLTVASLTRRKAHDVLIDALASLTALPWELRLVGSGAFDPDWERTLREQVKRCGLTDRIRFAGAVADVQDEYRRADLFVLPSRFEGYGMVFAEALAAGLPVVAARAGAVPDVVPETAGLLVPPDDPRALAGALHRLLAGRALRDRLRCGARAAAEKLPTWKDSARRVDRLIDGVSCS